MNLMTVLLVLFLQQVPQNQLGTIQGVVTKTGSTKTPIAGAHVKVSDAAGNPSSFATETATDTDGRFRLTDVPVGIYQIEIGHESFGYPTGASDAKFRYQFSVAAGQVIRIPEVSLAPLGTIRGHVLDAEGRGVAGVPVEVLRLSTNGTGQRVWGVTSGRVFTDHDGAYHKTLYGSGDYYVRAVLESGLARVDVYHPETTEGNKAAPIILPDGGEAVADVRIGVAAATEGFEVSGKVKLPPVDAGAPFISLVLTRRDADGPVDPSAAYLRTSTRANEGVGDFQFRDVRPGNYELTAGARINSQSFSGKTLIDVHDSDVDGIEVAVHPPFEIKGRLLFDGEPREIALSRRTTQSAVPGTEVRLALMPRNAAPQNLGRYKPIIDATGTAFSFQDVEEGEYLLTAYLETDGNPSNGPVYIDDIRAAGRSVMDGGIRVGLDPADAIDIIVGTKGGSIEGQVVGNASNQPATLVVMPEAWRRNNRSLFRTMPLSSDGRFQAIGLAPGTYTVFAVPSPDSPVSLRSSDLTRLESRGLSITVQTEKTSGNLQAPFLRSDK